MKTKNYFARVMVTFFGIGLLCIGLRQSNSLVHWSGSTQIFGYRFWSRPLGGISVERFLGIIGISSEKCLEEIKGMFSLSLCGYQ